MSHIIVFMTALVIGALVQMFMGSTIPTLCLGFLVAIVAVRYFDRRKNNRPPREGGTYGGDINIE